MKSEPKARSLFPVNATPATLGKVPAVSPEMASFVTLGSSVAELLRKAAIFFDGALTLERNAVAMLAQAKARKAPKNEDQDREIQLAIKASTEARKAAVDYWEDLTKGLHGLHKLATAGRSRSVDPLEGAAKLLNGLHNGYLDEAERQAKIVADRERKIAEDKAAADREKELAALEATALEGEAASTELSERERIFVAFVACRPAGREGEYAETAAREAKYLNPAKQGARLLSTTKIVQAIEGRRTAAAARAQATAVERVPVVAAAPKVEAAVSKVAGTTNRTYRKAEIFDLVKFKAAAMAGTHGIPGDVLTIDEAACNRHAESLREQINAWPGVRLTSDRRQS